MTELNWDDLPNYYDHGVSKVVLYSTPESAVPWNGLVSVTESPVEGSQDIVYYDGVGNVVLDKNGLYSATIEAITYPNEFEKFDGYSEFTANQHRGRFGLCYRTELGDGYRLHLVYNALAKTVQKPYTTGALDASVFSWEILGTPVPIPGAAPGSHLVVDVKDAYPKPVLLLESILYGTGSTDPRLPSPEEVIELFERFVMFKVTYHGDGTWTAEGPDQLVYMTSEDTFEIISPTAFFTGEGEYQVSSY